MDVQKLMINILKGKYNINYYEIDQDEGNIYICPNANFTMMIPQEKWLLDTEKLENFKEKDVKKHTDIFFQNPHELKIGNVMLGEKPAPKKIRLLEGPDYKVLVNEEIFSLLASDKGHTYKILGKDKITPIAIIRDDDKQIGVICPIRYNG